MDVRSSEMQMHQIVDDSIMRSRILLFQGQKGNTWSEADSSTIKNFYVAEFFYDDYSVFIIYFLNDTNNIGIYR